MQLGEYPRVSLEQARAERERIKTTIKAGQNPVRARQRERVAIQRSQAQTFSMVADEWLEHGRTHPSPRTGRGWSETHLERNKGLLRRVLTPRLGKLAIQEVTEDDLRSILEANYKAGTRESARRAAAIANQIFRYAKERGKFTGPNPAAELLSYSTLAKPEVQHFAALGQKDVGPMLRALAESKTEPVTKAAIVLMLFTGLRDLSLRAAQWHEIDWDEATWAIPASRMKRRKSHTVPLPTQAILTLKRLQALTDRGPSSFVFASSSKAGYLAENTLRYTLHRLGFEVTAHGIRSLITDVLNENRFNADAVERQLDHVEKDAVRRAYLRSDFFEQRVQMMQWFADWCEAQMNEKRSPEPPSNVIPMRAA